MKAKAFLAVIFINLMCSSLCIADDGIWVRTGAPSILTKFSDISICYQSNQRRIFAAESSEVSNIWQSTDDGLTWLAPLNPKPGHYYKQIIMQPTTGNYGWALVPGNSYTDQDAGPYKSTNGGQDWSLREQGLSNSKWVKCLAVDISSPNLNVAYVGCEGNPNYANTRIFRMADGINWVASDFGIPNELGGVRDISLCEIAPNILYCAYIAGPGGSGSGLYYSSDSGQSWQLRIFDGSAYPAKVSVCPSNPDVVCVGENYPNYGKIYMTTNGGISWTYLQNSSCSAKISQIKFTRQGSGQRVYIAFSSSTDGQFHDHYWIMETGIDDQPTYLPVDGKIPGNRCAFSVGVDPSDPDNIYVGCQKMFYSSNDGGSNFIEMPGITSLPVKRLAVDLPVLLAQSDNMTFSSKNGGQDFTSEPVDTLNASGIVRDWGSDKWILGLHHNVDQFGGSGSLFYYPYDFDGGGPLLPSWRQIDSWDGTAVNCVNTDPTNDYIYVGANGPGMEAGRLYYGTIEGGFQYSYPPHGFDHVIVRAIDVRPGRDTIIVGGYDFGVDRSPDHGQTWEIIGHELQALVLSLQYCPNQPKIALTGTEYLSVFKCSNMDAINQRPIWPIWRQAVYGMMTSDARALRFHPTDNSVICATIDVLGNGQTYISADTARSWIRLDEGLEELLIHDFAIDPEYSDTFYAATENGVYKLFNPVWPRGSQQDLESQTWGPGTIIINGDLKIPAGVTLNIAAGTRIKVIYNFDKLESGKNISKSEIVVYGTLNASGTTENPIVFESSHPYVPAAGQWYGIRVEAGGALYADHCQIRHADYGIMTNGDAGLAINEVTIDQSAIDGISIVGSTDVLIDHCHILNSGAYGIYCNTGNFSATYDEIDRAKYGIFYKGTASPLIAGCQITTAPGTQTYYGIWAVSGGSAPSPRIEDNYISGFAQRGIYLYGVSNTSQISNNEISQSGVYGIYCDYCSPQIVTEYPNRNLIRGNTCGLKLANGSSPMVRRAKFLDNTSRGVEINTGCWPDFGTADDFGYNSFIVTTMPPPPIGYYYHMYNYNILTLNVTGNYWNPGASGYLFNVIENKPLTSDPCLPKRSLGGIWLPEDLSLATAYPNPFNPSVTISFNLSWPQYVSVKVYNIMGQEVKELYSGTGKGGANTFIWDGTDSKGSPVSTGLYICNIRTENKQQTIKMTVLR